MRQYIIRNYFAGQPPKAIAMRGFSCFDLSLVSRLLSPGLHIREMNTHRNMSSCICVCADRETSARLACIRFVLEPLAGQEEHMIPPPSPLQPGQPTLPTESVNGWRLPRSRNTASFC